MSYSDNIFTAMIDEQGIIWEAGTGRKRQAVGIDMQKESDYQAQILEMQGVIDNYYNKLVELGAITPPKTPEQIAQEQAAQQAEINAKLLEAISGLHAELGELKKNGRVRCSDEAGNKPVGQTGEILREVTRSGKGRNAAGTKAIAGNS